jgi:hypothetical protein
MEKKIMKLNESQISRKIGAIIGFIVMYLIFTLILFFVLRLLNKIPDTWTIFHLSIITIFIVLIGTLIKLLLK